ncbi:hypothetical protein J2T60_002346 [Natronospira proteinivora]|uniref:Uncharacterized protein n=1 Tax=Natronospira proteinivora TaxID=1807133 RepID=A0ABT1GAJ5_9GAMM|nr:hypothetical protein [Natronospira proteinivora]
MHVPPARGTHPMIKAELIPRFGQAVVVRDPGNGSVLT